MKPGRPKVRVHRFRSRIVRLICGGIAAAVSAAPYSVSDDLPNPSAHFETLPAGSLVIPMDNTLQSLVSPFNLKAYGLVNRLLQNGIPVKWAIKAGKAKDGTDFTANAQRIAPTAVGAASLNFAGGPFVVHRDYAQLARAYITAFGNNVAVYELTAPASIDVRYDITFKPNIAVNDDNSGIHTDLFDFALIPNYTVIPGASLLADSCFTIFTEPHTNDTSGVTEVKAYVQTGGNFTAECLAVDTYENAGHFQTTAGIVTNNINNVIAYPNADLAFTQFIGVLEPAPGGSHQDWNLDTGSAFQNNGFVALDDVGASPATYVATVAKLTNTAGGMVFYLGGHNYGAGGNDITTINGQRMILNTVFVPNNRAACSFDFSSSIKTISGTIYEDIEGDGSIAGGVVRPNVNVRLYQDANANGVVDAADVFVTEQQTDASGNYSFQVSTVASGSRYVVTVDSRSIIPSAGLNGGFSQSDVWAEQTYGDNPATLALDVGPRFGGRTANVSDRYNTASTLPANNTYEHVAVLDVSGGNASNVDFAFSFNVVTDVRGGDATDDDTSANRTVQGTLRQFIQNANAISGANAMRFVPAVSANAGTWWGISVTSALPSLSDTSTTIDGRAYDKADGTTVVDANAGTLGTGGNVGVDNLALSTTSRPELEIQNLRSSAVVNVGLDVQAASAAIRHIAIYGFGAAVDSDASANIRIGASGTNAIVEQDVIGTGAGAFTDPGAATRSVGDDVRIVGGTGAVIQNNVIGFSGGNGIAFNNNATGAQVLSNEIRGNGLTNPVLSGLNVGSGGTVTIQGNLLAANNGAGIETAAGAGTNTIVNNTVSGNGIGGGAVTSGIRLLGLSNTVDRVVITNSAGAGIIVGSAAAQNTITKNSIFANGGIGIDLLSAGDNQATGTAPFVTPNDNGDGDTGGNGLLNFPVITGAAISNGNLILKGFARPGAVIELFIADPDPTGFGEGKTYLTTLTEGSGQDTDPSTGSYSNPVNGLNQGADTTNRFTFTIPVPGGVALGTVLTATGTLSNATSEFSGNITVTPPIADISGYVYQDANLNLQRDSSEAGTGLTLYVKAVSTSTPAGPAVAAAAVDGTTGTYSLTNIPVGVYTLILDDNNTLSDVTPALPAGWSGTEMPGGTRSPVAINAVNIPNQNFGLYHGLAITGRVFNDSGTGGGTANDGILNGGEAGLASAVVKLTDTTGATVYSNATTDATGGYALAIPSSIVGGTQLKISETNPAGFISTGASIGNTAGSYDRATDTITFNLTANTTYTNVNLGDVPTNTFNTDGQQAGLPGTTLYYPHSFSAASSGTVSFAAASTQNPATPAWTSTIYRDSNSNGQIDAGELAINGPVAVNAGDNIAIVVKIFIPTNAPLGARDQTTLTASFNYSSASPALNASLSRQDVSTVGNPTTAGLTLSKTVDKPSAAPGETITYTITFTNTSSDELRNVIIYDSTPAFTTFVSGTNGALPADLTGVVFSSPPVAGTGAMRWTFAGTLRPGGTSTVQFQVKVDQ